MFKIDDEVMYKGTHNYISKGTCGRVEHINDMTCLVKFPHSAWICRKENLFLVKSPKVESKGSTWWV